MNSVKKESEKSSEKIVSTRVGEVRYRMKTEQTEKRGLCGVMCIQIALLKKVEV